MGKKLCKGFLVFYVFIGCDMISVIVGVGKKKFGRFYDVVKYIKKVFNGRVVIYF